MNTARAIDENSPDRMGSTVEELELALAGVWCEVFQREYIGREENFFELGGNSLLGMDLTEILASRLLIHIPVLVIFQHPTIREMAEFITTADDLS